MPIKSVKIEISKNKKIRFFLMSQGSINPKIRFPGQKMCPVAREQTDTKVTTVGTLSGFQEFFLQLSSRIGTITCFFTSYKRIYFIVWVIFTLGSFLYCLKPSLLYTIFKEFCGLACHFFLQI